MYSIQVNFSLQRFFTKEAVPVTFSTIKGQCFFFWSCFFLALSLHDGVAVLSSCWSKAKQPCLLQSALAYSYLSSIKNFTDKVACIIQNFFRTPKEALFLSVWRSQDLFTFFYADKWGTLLKLHWDWSMSYQPACQGLHGHLLPHWFLAKLVHSRQN